LYCGRCHVAWPHDGAPSESSRAESPPLRDLLLWYFGTTDPELLRDQWERTARRVGGIEKQPESHGDGSTPTPGVSTYPRAESPHQRVATDLEQRIALIEDELYLLLRPVGTGEQSWAGRCAWLCKEFRSHLSEKQQFEDRLASVQRERDLARQENAQCWKLINGRADAALIAQGEAIRAALTSRAEPPRSEGSEAPREYDDILWNCHGEYGDRVCELDAGHSGNHAAFTWKGCKLHRVEWPSPSDEGNSAPPGEPNG